MLRHVIRRVAVAIPLVVIVSFMVFAFIDLAPGDAATRLAGERDATPERIEQIRGELGLDDPLMTRYARWAGDAVQGDLGESLFTSEQVSDMIGRRITVTMSLIAVSLVLTVVISVVFGVLAALRPGKLVDRIITAAASVAIAVPPFYVGVVLVVVFAVNRSWFPAIGYEPIDAGVGTWLHHLVLPAVSLALFQAAELTLQLKNSLIETLGRTYVLAAEARGLGTASVVMKHGLKNAASPVVTVLGFRLASLLGGTVTVETVFVLPGLGTLAVHSVLGRDIPVLLGLVVVTAVMVMVINLVVDLSYGYLNPKVRT